MVAAQVKSLHEKLLCEPLGTVVRHFLDYLVIEAGLSENTVLAYGRDLLGFVKYCTLHKTTAIEQVRQELIFSYIQVLSKEHKSESSINRALISIKMLLRFAILTGRLTEDFTGVLEGPKLWKRLPVVCRTEQVVKLLNTPQPEEAYYLRDKAILEMLYATGCRASEVANMKIDNLNFSIGYVRVFGKGKKERIVPLGRIAMEITQRYLQELRPGLVKPFSDDFVFLSRTGRVLDRIDIWRLVKKYAQRAGMPKNLTVHTLRHCFASHLLSGGADLRSVQEMLGHVDVTTTQIYTHVDQERLRSIHKQFHPRA